MTKPRVAEVFLFLSCLPSCSLLFPFSVSPRTSPAGAGAARDVRRLRAQSPARAGTSARQCTMAVRRATVLRNPSRGPEMPARASIPSGDCTNGEARGNAAAAVVALEPRCKNPNARPATRMRCVVLSRRVSRLRACVSLDGRHVEYSIPPHCEQPSLSCRPQPRPTRGSRPRCTGIAQAALVFPCRESSGTVEPTSLLLFPGGLWDQACARGAAGTSAGAGVHGCTALTPSPRNPTHRGNARPCAETRRAAPPPRRPTPRARVLRTHGCDSPLLRTGAEGGGRRCRRCRRRGLRAWFAAPLLHSTRCCTSVYKAAQAACSGQLERAPLLRLSCRSCCCCGLWYSSRTWTRGGGCRRVEKTPRAERVQDRHAYPAVATGAAGEWSKAVEDASTLLGSHTSRAAADTAHAAVTKAGFSPSLPLQAGEHASRLDGSTEAELPRRSLASEVEAVSAARARP
eukprot:362907-Chlamydomonas_euryale.AAC.14